LCSTIKLVKANHALQPRSKAIATRSAKSLARFMSCALLPTTPPAATRFGCCKQVISISNLVNGQLWGKSRCNSPPAPGPPAGQKVRSTHSAYFQTSPIAFARPQAVELFRARNLHRRDHTWRHLRFHRSVIKPPTRDDVCELTHTADTPSPMARLPELLGKADRDGAGRSLTITVLLDTNPTRSRVPGLPARSHLHAAAGVPRSCRRGRGPWRQGRANKRHRRCYR
jgi:hypothetical protein